MSHNPSWVNIACGQAWPPEVSHADVAQTIDELRYLSYMRRVG